MDFGNNVQVWKSDSSLIQNAATTLLACEVIHELLQGPVKYMNMALPPPELPSFY